MPSIDTQSANKQNKTGVEQYCFQLIEALKKLPDAQSAQVVLFSPTVLEGALADIPSTWQSRVLAWRLGRGWMSLRVVWELWRTKPSVFFVPGQSLPPTWLIPKSVRVVTTIHDVAFATFPQLHIASTRWRLQRATMRAIKRAEVILTPSQATKDDLVRIYHVDETRVVVTPLAGTVGKMGREKGEEGEREIEKEGDNKTIRLPQTNYFLFVGRLEKKKNVSMLVRAFNQFKAQRGYGDPYELVIVGQEGFGGYEIRREIDESPYKSQIHVTGFLSQEELTRVYKNASALVFPSWCEGFGIPLVDAMSYGVSVIASDIPVHHEVAHDVALFALPHDVTQWVNAMEKGVNDKQWKEEMAIKGKQRAGAFTWEKTAQMTWDVLKSLTNKN